MPNVFTTIDKNIDSIFKFILQDDDIKKLLGNNARTALTDSVPSKDWMNDYLFDTPRVPDTQSEVKSFLIIEMESVGKAGNNNITPQFKSSGYSRIKFVQSWHQVFMQSVSIGCFHDNDICMGGWLGVTKNGSAVIS